MTKEEKKAYQENWRKNHHNYFKQYYLDLKAGKHKAYKSLFNRVINLIENYNKKKGGKK